MHQHQSPPGDCARSRDSSARPPGRRTDRGGHDSIHLAMVGQFFRESDKMLDHIGIPVSELGRSKRFFVAALAPLGYKVIFDLPTAVGMGDEAFPSFWIGGSESRDPLHIAFSASNRAAVDAFHRAALAAGG